MKKRPVQPKDKNTSTKIEFLKPNQAKSEKRRQSKPPQKPIFEPQNGEKPAYAFIDASNLFWGGKESIGFGVGYKKLLDYMHEKFGVEKTFYYGGVRIFDFSYSILENKPLDLSKLSEYLHELKKTASESDAALIERSISKINFYQLLEGFGYVMKIKPAKVYYDEEDENHEQPILKANCDVDMTFDMMRYMPQYSNLVALSGDGDFAMVLSYLKSHGRKVTVISRWQRTAKEIREIAGDNYVDFDSLKGIIEYNK